MHGCLLRRSHKPPAVYTAVFEERNTRLERERWRVWGPLPLYRAAVLLLSYCSTVFTFRHLAHPCTGCQRVVEGWGKKRPKITVFFFCLCLSVLLYHTSYFFSLICQPTVLLPTPFLPSGVAYYCSEQASHDFVRAA